MKLLKSLMLCSLLCTVTPSNAIYIIMDQKIIDDLMSGTSLSTAKAISCAMIACIAGAIVGSQNERIEINESFKQLDPELANVDILVCKWTKTKLAILSAVALGCIGLLTRVNEQSSAFAQLFPKIISTVTILTGSICGVLYSAQKMGINIS